MSYGPKATPARNQAFTLDNYFNSTSTDPKESPAPKNGLALPTPNWGQGLRAWRREWVAWNPALSRPDPFWSPGLRKIVVGASKAVNPSYFAAAGQVFTVNAWDVQGATKDPATTQVSDFYFQVAAYFIDASNNQVFIEPSTLFANYCWGEYTDKAPLIAFPKRAAGQEYVQISQKAASPMPILSIGGPGKAHRTGPQTEQQMGVGAMISLLFNSTLPTPPPAPVVHLQFATYMALTPPNGPAVQCFEDPEMDVDMGSNT